MEMKVDSFSWFASHTRLLRKLLRRPFHQPKDENQKEARKQGMELGELRAPADEENRGVAMHSSRKQTDCSRCAGLSD